MRSDGRSSWRKHDLSSYSPMYTTQGAIMAVGASKPTSIADKDGYFSVKSQMLHFNWSSQTWYLLYSTSFSSHKLAKTR
ncbi:putative dihydrolipoyllysine-residue acetyltransferase [Helianthus annuus]|nr:putative dihydrolipoyllysine-residue acetyltransferase [Helianthus annuus]